MIPRDWFFLVTELDGPDGNCWEFVQAVPITHGSSWSRNVDPNYMRGGVETGGSTNTNVCLLWRAKRETVRMVCESCGSSHVPSKKRDWPEWVDRITDPYCRMCMSKGLTVSRMSPEARLEFVGLPDEVIL